MGPVRGASSLTHALKLESFRIGCSGCQLARQLEPRGGRRGGAAHLVVHKRVQLVVARVFGAFVRHLKAGGRVDSVVEIPHLAGGRMQWRGGGANES